MEMMIKNIQESVTESIENMAFAEVILNSHEKKMPEPEGEVFWGSLEVISPVKGVVTVMVPRPLAEELAESIYEGGEEFVLEGTIRDVVAEVLNTLAGVFVKKVTPEDVKFEVGLPVIDKNPPSTPEGPYETFFFNVNERPFAVVMAGFEGLDC